MATGNNRDHANVVSLDAFRSKKQQDDELASGRKPLYASHLDGKVTGSPYLKRPEDGDFGDRLQRIKASLEKINALMGDLKRISAQDDASAAQKTSKK